MEATRLAKAKSVDMKLEVVMIGVSDIDRAKAFYEKLGWRLDANFAAGDFHAVQVTPHNSAASIIFGKGIPSPEPGSARGLVLAVDDVGAARDELVARGVDVSEVFHYAGGPFNLTVGENPRVSGRDPEGRSYYSFASFEDPDGNGWLLQEIQTRLPGREWKLTPSTSHGRRDACRTPPRDRTASRRLREDARRAPLVGLVRALFQCSSERQHSGRGRRRRRPPHG